jgi:hypothetical protein
MAKPAGSGRSTRYATELTPPGVVTFEDGSEGRIELLHVKKQNQEEIRFSWWRDGRIIPRPLDLPEAKLLDLLKDGFEKGVLSPEFLNKLRAFLT